MSGLTGGTVYDVYNGRNVSWKPAGPVVDEWAFYTANSADAYLCLGVVGDRSHWAVQFGGDHTSRSTHDTIVGGRTVWPKAGWVYAIDGRVPEPSKFEQWFIGRLRAGAYPNVKYWNINNRHWNRKNGWRSAVYSSDGHLHISFIPGAEYADSSILADYEAHRRGAAPRPPAPVPSTDWRRQLPGKLPTIQRGAKGPTVRTLQGLLCANGTPTGVDGDFGPLTHNATVRFQQIRRLMVDGIAGPQTWGALLSSANQVQLGSTGLAVRCVQGLLVARGNPTGIDGDFGPLTHSAVTAFQSRVGIGVDGIVGPITWGRLVAG